MYVYMNRIIIYVCVGVHYRVYYLLVYFLVWEWEWEYVHIDRIPLGLGVGSYLRLEIEYIVLLVVVVALGYTLGFILYALIICLE